jgi:hypothetical protein
MPHPSHADTVKHHGNSIITIKSDLMLLTTAITYGTWLSSKIEAHPHHRYAQSCITYLLLTLTPAFSSACRARLEAVETRLSRNMAAVVESQQQQQQSQAATPCTVEKVMREASGHVGTVSGA